MKTQDSAKWWGVAFWMVVAVAPSMGHAQGNKPNSQMQAVLDKLAGLDPKPIETLTPAEARKGPTPADAVKALLVSQGKATSPEPIGKVSERTIDTRKGKLPVRVYTPEGAGPFPVILYFHGGGWVIATNDTYDATPRALVKQTSAVVISVEYSKAPEHKFPAAHDEAFAAYRWVLEHAREVNGDAARVAVVGESAGGNLAANVSLAAKAESLPLPVYQVLVYPVAGSDMSTPSYKENANAKPLNKAMMQWFVKHTFDDPSQANDPRIALVKRTDLKGLPNTTIISAQIDPLRSEGKALADALTKAGVKVSYKNYAGATHEFFGMAAVLDAAKNAQAKVGKDLNGAFRATRKPTASN